MKLPKKLKIGAHTYTIEIKELDNNLGECDRLKNKISLDKRLPHTQLVATLFHEIFHALNNETDHEKVDGKAEQLTQVLLDNKLLK